MRTILRRGSTSFGYVSGVGDAMGYVPAGLMAGQLAAVVSKYLTNHPEKWSEPAVDLVIKALQEAFPLKRREMTMKTVALVNNKGGGGEDNVRPR